MTDFEDELRPRENMISTRLLRRLWILPVSIVLVAAIAYAVAGVQSSTYTATSTVVVSSVPGAVSASNSSGAGSLASTYAGALPSDGALQAYVSRTAHVPATNNAIKAGAPRGSAITFTFTAPTRAAAIAGGRALANGLTAAKPVSPTVSAGTLKLVQSPTTATATAAGSYRAKVVVLVPASGGPTEGINPDDADQLATTYAGSSPWTRPCWRTSDRRPVRPSARSPRPVRRQRAEHLASRRSATRPRTRMTATTGARTAATPADPGPNPVAAGSCPPRSRSFRCQTRWVPPQHTHLQRSTVAPIVIGGARTAPRDRPAGRLGAV